MSTGSWPVFSRMASTAKMGTSMLPLSSETPRPATIHLHYYLVQDVGWRGKAAGSGCVCVCASRMCSDLAKFATKRALARIQHHHHLADALTQQLSVLASSAKRRVRPQVQRVDRLNIKVAVNQHRLALFTGRVPSILSGHDGVTSRLMDCDGAQSCG